MILKNLFMFLILANAFSFLWQNYINDSDPGMSLLDRGTLDHIGNWGESSAEEDVINEKLYKENSLSSISLEKKYFCLRIGPFKTKEDIEDASENYFGSERKVEIVTKTAQNFIGHWVQIRDIEDTKDGQRIVGILHHKGIGEAYLVTTEDQELKVSLGLFEDISRAESLKNFSNSLGFNTDVSPRIRENKIFYLNTSVFDDKEIIEIRKYFDEVMVSRIGIANC